MDLVTGLALAALLLLFCVLAFSRRENAPAAPEAPRLSDALQRRIETYIAVLDDDDEAAAAERSLLSMGPHVIPHLLSFLERVDVQPFALTPAQQLAIERLLADFGPQTFHQITRFLRRVHRVSPVFPAVLRVLEEISPLLLQDLVCEREELPFSLLAPVLAKVRQRVPPLTYAQAIAANFENEALLVAALPHLTAEPELRELVTRLAPGAGAALNGLLQRVGVQADIDRDALPEAKGALAEMGPTEVLLALDAERLDRMSAICALAPHMEDPRVQERIIALVEVDEHDAEVGTVAFRELARVRFRNLQPLINRLLRAPALSPRDMARLRGGLLLHPAPCVQALVLGLRSETPKVVLRASEVLAAMPVEAHLASYLKGLGRHRYSPLEAALAAPVLARWQTLAPQVLALSRHEDREVQLSAIELIGFYGDASDAEFLLELWGRRDVLNDVVANAVEIIGPSAVDALARKLEASSGSSDEPLLRRRLEVLRLLAGRPVPAVEPSEQQKDAR